SVQWEPHKAPGLDAPVQEFVTTPGDVFVWGSGASDGRYSVTSYDRAGVKKGVGQVGLGVAGSGIPRASIVSSALSVAPKTLIAALGFATPDLSASLTQIYAVTGCTDTGCDSRLVAQVSDALPGAVYSDGTIFRAVIKTSDGRAALVTSDAGAA